MCRELNIPDAAERLATRGAVDRWLLGIHAGFTLHDVDPITDDDVKSLDICLCGVPFDEIAARLGWAVVEGAFDVHMAPTPEAARSLRHESGDDL